MRSRSAEAKSLKQRPGFRKKLEIDRNPNGSAAFNKVCKNKSLYVGEAGFFNNKVAQKWLGSIDCQEQQKRIRNIAKELCVFFWSACFIDGRRRNRTEDIPSLLTRLWGDVAFLRWVRASSRRLGALEDTPRKEELKRPVNREPVRGWERTWGG